MGTLLEIGHQKEQQAVEANVNAHAPAPELETLENSKNQEGDVEQKHKKNVKKQENEFSLFLEYVRNVNGNEKFEKIKQEDLQSVYRRIKSHNYNIFDFFYVFNETSNVLQIIPAYTFFFKKISAVVEYLNFEYASDYFDIIVKRKDWQSESRWRVFYKEHEWKKSTNSYWRQKFHFMARRAGIIDMIKIIFADILENEIGIYYHDDNIYNVISKDEFSSIEVENQENKETKQPVKKDVENNVQEDGQTVVVSIEDMFYADIREMDVVKDIYSVGEPALQTFRKLYEKYRNKSKGKKDFFSLLDYLYKRINDVPSVRERLKKLYVTTTNYYEKNV